MKITQRMLRNILPDHVLTNIGLPTAWSLAKGVARYYCTPLTLASKCPMDCEKCRARFEGVIEGIQNTKFHIDKPYGMFVYRMRNLVNDATEVQPKVIVKKDKFGIPEEKSGTVWEHLLAGL